MRTLGENDMRWFAARLSIAVEEVRRFKRMSVHEMRQALRDIPGAESLTIGPAENGDELVTIAGRTVAVRPGATHEEIALAFREPAMSTPNVTVTPLPEPVAYAPATTRNSTMTTTPAPGGFAAEIRAMLDEARAGVTQARANGRAVVGDAVAKLHEAKTATEYVASKMAATIHDEAASVLAELGQISNDLGDTAG